jgi:hypothetical protein
MNWLFDEYFVKPEVWNAVFQPLGINCRRVLLHRTGQELESVLQLDIPKLVPLQMASKAFEYERCMDIRLLSFFFGLFYPLRVQKTYGRIARK